MLTAVQQDASALYVRVKGKLGDAGFTGEFEKDYAMVAAASLSFAQSEVAPRAAACVQWSRTQTGAIRAVAISKTKEPFDQLNAQAGHALDHEMSVDVTLLSGCLMLLLLLRSPLWALLTLPFRALHAVLCCVFCCSCLRGKKGSAAKASREASKQAKQQGKAPKIVTLCFRNKKVEFPVLPKTTKADIVAALKTAKLYPSARVEVLRLQKPVLAKAGQKLGVELFGAVNSKKKETWDVRE